MQGRGKYISWRGGNTFGGCLGGLFWILMWLAIIGGVGFLIVYLAGG